MNVIYLKKVFAAICKILPTPPEDDADAYPQAIEIEEGTILLGKGWEIAHSECTINGEKLQQMCGIELTQDLEPVR